LKEEKQISSRKTLVLFRFSYGYARTRSSRLRGASGAAEARRCISCRSAFAGPSGSGTAEAPGAPAAVVASERQCGGERRRPGRRWLPSSAAAASAAAPRARGGSGLEAPPPLPLGVPRLRHALRPPGGLRPPPQGLLPGPCPRRGLEGRDGQRRGRRRRRCVPPSFPSGLFLVLLLFFFFCCCCCSCCCCTLGRVDRGRREAPGGGQEGRGDPA